MPSANSSHQISLSLWIVIFAAFAMTPMKAWRARGQANTVTTVSAASYTPGLAPESIAAAFGSRLATQIKLAEGLPLPTNLAGTTVKVNGELAPLFFVSPNQINYQIPPGVAAGAAQVVVTSSDGTVSTGTVQVSNTAPAIFTANATGAGLPAAVALRLAGGAQTFEPIDRPIILGPESDRLFLILYVCGVRRAAPGMVNVIIGNDEIPAAFAGPAPGFAGLDQINVELPRYLSGRGRLPLRVKVDGVISNQAELEFGGPDLRTAATLALSSSVNPSIFGQAISFSAAVNPVSGSEIPTGTVTFKDAFNGVTVTLGAATLSAARAAFSTASLGAGAHQITAEYAGKGFFKPSTAALGSAQNVNKSATVASLTSSTNPANRSQAITLTAEVKPHPTGAFTPTGIVQFKDNNSLLSSPMTLINGRASLITDALALGPHNITADYYGDPNFQPIASAAFSQTIATPILQVSGIMRSSPTYASDEITINGSGFTTNPADHEIKVVDDDGKETTAQLIAAAADQLRVRVPFGAGSGKIRVRVLGGPENESPDRLELGTSVSGFVQEFKNGERTPVPGLPIALREQSGRRVETTTSSDGSFVLKGAVSSSVSLIEIARQTVNGVDYPAQSRKMQVLSNRDNQYKGDGELANIIEIKQNSATSTGLLFANTAVNESLNVAAPASPADIADVITSGQVTFDTNNSTITFPGGGTSGNLGLTVLDPGRTPSNLPISYFSSTIAQITPFGAALSPGGKLTFPNSDGIPVGTQVRVFRFDQTTNSQTLGQFIDIGAGTISADGTKIETAANAVTQTSYYFVSRQWPTATINGRVVESDGRPARRAVVNARGQAVFTDNRGGFALADIPVITPSGVNDQVTVEISLVRADGSVARTQREVTINAKTSSTITQDFVLPPEIVNRSPQITAPLSLVVDEGDRSNFDLVISDPDGQPLTAAVSGAPFATLANLSLNVYRLRLAPNAGDAGNHTILIQARDSLGLIGAHRISVTVQRSNNTLRANYLSLAADEDAGLNITLSVNGASGISLNYTLVTTPSHGTLTGAPPNLRYTPAPNYNGPDSFSFKAAGANRESNVAVVYIAVNPINDAPSIVVPGPQRIAQSREIAFVVTATDVDAEQTLQCTATGLPPSATLFQLTPASWQFRWTPIFSELGMRNVTFTVRDSGAPSLSASGQTTITVEGKLAASSGLEGGTIWTLLSDGANIFAGTEGGGLFRSTDQGRNWVTAGAGMPPETAIRALLRSGPSLYAATFGGVYRSNNNGASWQTISSGLFLDQTYQSLVKKGSVLFTGTNGFGGGIYRSLNDGASWGDASSGLPRYTDAEGFRRYRTVWTLEAVGDVIYAGTLGGGVYRSFDNGGNWAPVNGGLTNLDIYALKSAGADLFAATNNGVWRLPSGASNWIRTSKGITDPLVNSLIAVNGVLIAGTQAADATRSGAYLSTDGGETWIQNNKDGFTNSSVLALAISPDGRTVCAGTTGTGVLRTPINLQGTQSSWANGLNPVNQGLTATNVNAFAAAGGSLFVATGGSGLFRSADNGLSWQRALSDSIINTVFVSGAEIFVGHHDQGVFISRDDGMTWQQSNTGLANRRVFSFAQAGLFLFAGTNGGLFRSADRGQSWTIMNGLGNQPVQTIVVAGATLYAGTFAQGVYRSNDLGQTWIQVQAGLANLNILTLGIRGAELYAGTNGGGVFRLPLDGSIWTAVNGNLANLTVRALIVKDSTLYAGTYGGGVFSLPSGASAWQQLNTGATNNGLRSVFVRALGVNAGRLFAGLQSAGVYRSDNSGQTWTDSNPGLGGGFITNIALSGSSLIATTFGGGLFRSTDGGQSWTQFFLDTFFNADTFSNAIFVNGATVYVGLNGGNGAYVSTDGGQTWRAAPTGLDNRIVQSFTASGSFIFAGTEDGVFRTANSGQSWERAANGLGSNADVEALATLGSAIFAGVYDGGVFRSFDNGLSWNKVGGGVVAQRVATLTVISGRIFAGTDGGGIFRSTDGGQTWSAVNTGLFNLFISALAGSGDTLYAGTVGGGVFVSLDGGQSWSQSYQGLGVVGDANNNVQAFAFSGGKLIIATEGYIFPTLVYEEYRGRSWLASNVGLAASLVTDLALSGQSIFAITFGTGPYRSRDNGQSWRRVDDVFDSYFGNTVFVFGDDVFVGTNGGFAIRVSHDDGETWADSNNGVAGKRISSFAAIGATLYAAAFNENVGQPAGGVFRSTDGGKNWAIIPGLETQSVTTLAVRDGLLYAGTFGAGVFRLSSNGQWIPINTNLTNQLILSLLAKDGKLFAGTSISGVFRLNDDGQSWKRVTNGMGNQRVYALASRGPNLYAATNDNGVFLSNDDGENWSVIGDFNRTLAIGLAASDQGLYVGARGGLFLLTNSTQSWDGANTGLSNPLLNALVVNENDLLAGTVGGGVYRSADQGRNWEQTTGLPPNANIQSLGINSSTVFAGLASNGVYRSSNSGRSWTSSGLAGATVTSFAARAGKFYAGAAANPPTGQTGGVFVSSDNGVNWQPFNNGLDNREINVLAAFGNRLFAGTLGGGIFISNTDGANWRAVNSVSNPNLRDVRALAKLNNAVFAGTVGGGVYRSLDDGETWTAINNGLPSTLSVYAFAVVGGRLYAGSVYGVFVSSDSGGSWQQVNAGLREVSVTGLAVKGNRIFAGTLRGGVFTTTDAAVQ